ncbi:MAG: hypothetical protein ABI844_19030 [Saprospiraceae bacterium]
MTLIFMACRQSICPESKTSLLNDFNKFVNTTVRTKQFYNIKEWESKDKEFTSYLQTCYAPYDTLMYLDERQKFFSDALRYYFKRYDNRVTIELLNSKNPNSKLLQTQIKSIWANPDQAFSQIFEEMTGLKFDEAVEAVRSNPEK